ncbi:MAG: restriction endonuclease subunit S [Deltaproteobacteria bacterium]|jgi:type I restriction enzyme S subunit
MTPREAIPELPLSELGTVFTGRTPPSEVASYFGSGCPFITPTDMTGQKYIRQAERELSPEGEALLARIVVPARSVMVSCIGWQMGKSAMTDRPSVTNQQLNTIVPNERVDADYLYYALTTRRDELKRLGSVGTRTPIVNKSVFSALRIPVPPLAEQRRIAGILSAYDDLIENCERRIRVLDEMARALYREWFVLFRYPGHEKTPLVDSTLGRIPKGWEVRPVSESFEILGGGTPSRKEPDYWTDGTVEWFSPTHLTSAGTMFMDTSGERITERGLAESSAKLFPAMSVMMTSRATIGAIAINTTPACTNQGFITCIPNERMPLLSLFHWLRSNVPLFERMASGATFKEISRGVFRTIDVLLPASTLIQRFENVARPMADESLSLQRSLGNLRKTRDLLLPRLLSGELSVDDAA